MAGFTRYAVYVVPDGALYERGARWLGWDIRAGRFRPHPDLDGLADLDIMRLTARPRRYGFHATVKAPFALTSGADQAGLVAGLGALAAQLAPVEIPRLDIRPLGRFVAIQPTVEAPGLCGLADRVVEEMETYRAPLTTAEFDRRSAGLSARKRENLRRWGYPFVHDDYRFHLTLTGPVDDPDAVSTVLGGHFRDLLPGPLRIDALALVGEAPDGTFHLIDDVPLGRSAAV